ncbi:hypothetical protein B0H17DRAFT_671993 [Mycena rosella]|uniref:Uncharacterized protein n=1 Tax=Mycena rosella TaxID=1033263 RepID=A0AAD7GUJ9_MYCRO|nr:hypothetical protein B0H17DRAFT_671993 [Mycena rosella]
MAKPTEFIELSVVITYDVEKSGYKQRDDPKDTIARLRRHLTALRMPHPKQENVRTIDGDGVCFSWTTQEDSMLHQQVSGAVLAQRKSVLRQYCMKSVKMSVQPTDPPAAPLLLPVPSRRDSFSTSAPVAPEPGSSSMHDKAQQFLDGLHLAPPVLLPTRAASVLSSTCSSRNNTPPAVEPVVALKAEADPMEVLEQASLGLVAPDPCPSSPGSDDMVLSPIPGLAALPLCSSIIIDKPAAGDAPRAPLETDMPVVQQLSTTLLDIHKEVYTGLIKADAIRQALKTMDALGIPEPSHELSSGEQDFVAKVRLQLLQSELEHTRLRRQAVEESIRGITRESRPPFVCPALMDAFVAVSQLTTQAMEAES